LLRATPIPDAGTLSFFDKAETVATYMPDGGWIQIWPFKFYFIGAVCCKLVQTLCEIPWVESELVESDVHPCPTS
jgi:hypothetical protein